MSSSLLFHAYLQLSATILLVLLPPLVYASLAATRSKSTNSDELLDFLKKAGPLYSGAFAMITSFSCSRPAEDRVQLLKRLSGEIGLLSNVLDLDDSIPRLAEIAWEKGYRAQEIPFDAHRILFILDLDCPNVDEFLSKADAEFMFASPFKWLLIQGSNDSDYLASKLAQVGAYPDSELAVWQKESGQLLSLYRTNANNSHFVEKRGSWTAAQERSILLDDLSVASRRRRNLGGIELKSCLVITDPNTVHHLSDYQDRHVDSITKCNYPWALFLAEMLNATVKFERAGTWGYQKRNGSWDGMIGMLQRGEIDFGGTGTFLMRERIGIIQYISLSTPTGSRFIFRSPPLSSVSNLFRLPFRNSVWLGSLALVVLLIILLYPAMKHESSRARLQINEMDKARSVFSEDVLVVVGAVTQQGSWYEPRSVPTRIICLFALLAFLNLYAAYTANIVALLQSTTRSINTLTDLMASPLILAAHDNVFNRYYFKSFQDPVRRAIFEERIEPKGSSKKSNWLGIEDGIERIRGGYFAFHVEPGCAYKLIQETYQEDEKCGFQEIDYLNVFDPHFIVKRRSPYLELLRVGAMKLHETGMRTRDIGRLYTKKPECRSASRFLSVGLTESYGAFLTLGYGSALALGLLIFELLVSKFSLSDRLQARKSRIPRNKQVGMECAPYIGT